MKLDTDVNATAKHFAGASDVFAQLLQAVVQAEGNILRAVQCSYPQTQTRVDALAITARSAVHALADFVSEDPGLREAFVTYWGARWAPLGAANDPHNLNANWVPNVLTGWRA